METATLKTKDREVRGAMLYTLAYIGNEEQMRLACRTKVLGDIEVQSKPPLNLFGENFFS